MLCNSLGCYSKSPHVGIYFSSFSILEAVQHRAVLFVMHSVKSCTTAILHSCTRKTKQLVIKLLILNSKCWFLCVFYYIWQTQILLKKGQWTLPYQGTLSWDDRGIVIKGIPPRPHQEIPCTAHSVLLVWDFFIASHGSIIWDYKVHKHAFWQDLVR